MTNFNPDFIRALAHGDAEAHEQVNKLPLIERMSIGNAVDQLRRDENIVPMSSGMSIYEQTKSDYIDDDAVSEAMQRRMDIEKQNREFQEQAREKMIAEQTRLAMERARSGLKRNDRLPR
ncbi:hypothetical protein [Metabacillus sp. FJAT-52054]|uniref:Uncharacterized protein n=1 Tax=Metabacillus sediminis TaxID=3117746 RepID=A0ABZ2NNU8_9BACI